MGVVSGETLGNAQHLGIEARNMYLPLLRTTNQPVVLTARQRPPPTRER